MKISLTTPDLPVRGREKFSLCKNVIIEEVKEI